jgi:hypothetical protein
VASTTTQNVPPVVTSAAPAAAPAAPTEPPLPPDNVPEIQASARMYAAHAPLRVPEVADPDSAANREILQAMVTKAIRRVPSATDRK